MHFWMENFTTPDNFFIAEFANLEGTEITECRPASREHRDVWHLCYRT